jgi:hypothetical protein
VTKCDVLNCRMVSECKSAYPKCDDTPPCAKLVESAPSASVNKQSVSALEVCVDFMREHGLGISPIMVSDLDRRLNGEAPLHTL